MNSHAENPQTNSLIMLNLCQMSVIVSSVSASSTTRLPLVWIKKWNTQIFVDDSLAVARDKRPDEVSGVYDYYDEPSKPALEKLHFEDMQSRVRMQMPLLGVWKRKGPRTAPLYLLVFAHQSGSTSIAQRWMITSSHNTNSIFGRASVKSFTKFDTTRPRSGRSPPPEFFSLNQSPKPRASISARESIQDLVQLVRDELATKHSEIEKLQNLNKELLATKYTMQSENEKLHHWVEFQKEQVRIVNAENERLNEKLDEMNNISGILLCTGGFLLANFGIFCLMYHYKIRSVMVDEMERGRRDERIMILKANEPLPVIPSVHPNRLGVNEHPVISDVFGMKEVFDVAAGEGKDLVRIALPLETAGAERELIEELMDIQPIIVGGDGSRGTQDTSSGTGKGTQRVSGQYATSGI